MVGWTIIIAVIVHPFNLMRKQKEMTIDYVVPMVFPEDIAWRHEMQNMLGQQSSDNATKSVRYRTWGTEEMLVKLIRKNMPWVRDIIILLARHTQVQPWMKEMTANKKKTHLRIVFHKDFMPKEQLPTFNSRAIEMYLHRIPGIAEYFVYGNDDMFPITPLKVEDFFQKKEDTILPCLQMTEKPFPKEPNQYHMACLNGLNFVARNFKKKFTTTWLHTGHSAMPILKSTCEMFWNRWKIEMEASITPFRATQNYNQYIYSWWQYMSGQYVNHVPPRKYVATNRNSPEEILQAIRDNKGVICINDHDVSGEVNPYMEMARKGLTEKLSEKNDIITRLFQKITNRINNGKTNSNTDSPL